MHGLMIVLRFSNRIKGKENPWFKLVYCDKRLSIRYTVD